jgi:hypothetical protein
VIWRDEGRKRKEGRRKGKRKLRISNRDEETKDERKEG